MQRFLFCSIRHGLLTVILGLGLISQAWAQSSYKLDPDAFEKGLKATPEGQLLDVRTPEEFSKEHLSHALNINYNGADSQKHLGFLDKAKPVYVYCLSGGRSTKAAAQMREMGFTQVYELDGGILKWNTQNKPLEKSLAKKEPGMSVAAFDQLLQSKKLVLVDFGAQWCPPCKKMAPIMDKVAEEMRQQVEVVKIDVDANAELAKQKGVSALPVLMLYKNKQVVWQQTGFMEEPALKEVIETYAR